MTGAPEAAAPLELADLQRMLETGPFNVFLGLRILECDTTVGQVLIEMPVRPEFERIAGSGQLHGGVIACLADVSGTFAAIAQLGRPVATIHIGVDFLRPAAGPWLRARATARRIGRRVGTIDADIFDAESRVVALGRGVMSL